MDRHALSCRSACFVEGASERALQTCRAANDSTSAVQHVGLVRKGLVRNVPFLTCVCLMFQSKSKHKRVVGDLDAWTDRPRAALHGRLV